MIAHQLDLFGGPLKPPKKITVDDDATPAEEPISPEEESNAGEDSQDKPTEPENGQLASQETNEEDKAVEQPETGGIHVEIPDPDYSINRFTTGEERNSVTVFASDDIEVEEPENLEGTSQPQEKVEVESNVSPIDEEVVENATQDEESSEQIPAEEDPEELNEEVSEEAPVASAESDTPGMEHSAVEGDNEADEMEEKDPEHTEAEPGEVATEPAEKPESDEEQDVVANDDRETESEKTTVADPETDSSGLNVPPDEELFKRQYYSMRETAAMFGVNQSLLRFWENEFDILNPKKNKKGDRYFRPVDVKNLVLIYHLLRVRKFTMEGAKEYLQANKKASDSFELIKKLEKIKSFLLELKAEL